MEIQEVADQIAEFEEREHAADTFRRRVALFISVLAMVLAITAVGSNKTGKELIGSAISASDSWAFYQAKTIRQTAYVLAADELEAFLQSGTVSEDGRKSISERIAKYRDTVKRYDSEADGTGKKELMEKAKHFEHERELAEHREPYFALAEALLQIAIVLASAAITTNARFLLWAAGGLGLGGCLMSLDAYTLLIHLPL